MGWSLVSAAQRQMDELQQKGLIVAATRRTFARHGFQPPPRGLR